MTDATLSADQKQETGNFQLIFVLLIYHQLPLYVDWVNYWTRFALEEENFFFFSMKSENIFNCSRSVA